MVVVPKPPRKLRVRLVEARSRRKPAVHLGAKSVKVRRGRNGERRGSVHGMIVHVHVMLRERAVVAKRVVRAQRAGRSDPKTTTVVIVFVFVGVGVGGSTRGVARGAETGHPLMKRSVNVKVWYEKGTTFFLQFVVVSKKVKERTINVFI